MEQQQFRVRFSLGTKLLFSVVTLLFLVILFLNLSTIFLLREDKRAYTYKAQSTETLLAGREVANTARRALETLRLALVSIDPRKGPQSAPAALKSMIDNQQDLALLSIDLLALGSGKLTHLSGGRKAESASGEKFALDAISPSEEILHALTPELRKTGYAFFNLSVEGGPPLLGVMVADTNLAEFAQGMPVAWGVVSLGAFAAEMKAFNVTVATQSGWVLFDTDPARLFLKKPLENDPLLTAARGSAIANGAQEFEAAGSRFLGSFNQPGLGLVVLSRTDWNKAMQATFALTEKFLLLGVMAIGCAVIFAIVFSKRLTRPILSLYSATREVAQGNFNVQLASQSKDEIGALTGSFNVMSAKINELIQESMRKVYLENELAIASTVQQNLIPPPTFKNSKIFIRSHYQSASECGGDWWGFFGVGNRISLMIADATGHGLPSALITAAARSCFSVMAKLAQEDADFSFSPSAMLSYANRVVFDASLGKINMTFFIGVIDFDTNVLTYSSAGHNPPWLFKKENEKFTLKSLTASGQRLGEARDAPAFEEKTTQLAPGDILFLYTDGLLEGKNLAGEQYGKKRSRKVIEKALSGGPERVIQDTVQDFLQHNAGKPLDDDLTLAAITLPEPGAAAGAS